MKRSYKIVGIVFGCLALLVIAGCLLIFGSNYMSARYEVDNPVYGPDRVWSFRADFYDSTGNLGKQDTILLTTYNQRFLFSQNKVTWSLQKGNTLVEQTTGVVEDQTKLWLHPPRFDDYVTFTEYSAFPEIRYPIQAGNTWETQLSLGTFATEETGKSMTVTYRIEQIDTLSTSPLNRQIHILGTGTSGLGTYTNEMLFTDSAGFTCMRYKQDNGKQLIIELIKKTGRI